MLQSTVQSSMCVSDPPRRLCNIADAFAACERNDSDDDDDDDDDDNAVAAGKVLLMRDCRCVAIFTADKCDCQPLRKAGLETTKVR